MADNSSSSSSSTWYHTYLKLRFFTRIRRLIGHKSHPQSLPSSSIHNLQSSKVSSNTTIIETEKSKKKIILESNNNNMEVGTGEKEEEEEEGDDNWVVDLQKAVKGLHFGSWEDKDAAAIEIKRLLAGEEDVKRRKLTAELGVIPPLVAMVGSELVRRRRLAIQALLELANGTCTNKALMVEAGILSKLPENIGVLEESNKHEFAQLVMSLSSLANSQFPINSSQILPFMMDILESDSSIDTQEMCLGTLYNLSTMLQSAGSLATQELVNTLLRLSLVNETSEKALGILGNLVVTLMGKKALENNPMVPESLIEIMAMEEKPKLQELSAYVLMILAHQSSFQRVKMAKAGIVHVLLEVALLGSPLAQKRALKLLQWFKDERQTRIAPHSGPQIRRLSLGSPVNRETANESKKMMKKMIKQSLYKNMETITRRANGVDQDSSSKLKFLIISSSSKSLPYLTRET